MTKAIIIAALLASSPKAKAPAFAVDFLSEGIAEEEAIERAKSYGLKYDDGFFQVPGQDFRYHVQFCNGRLAEVSQYFKNSPQLFLELTEDLTSKYGARTFTHVSRTVVPDGILKELHTVFLPAENLTVTMSWMPNGSLYVSHEVKNKCWGN